MEKLSNQERIARGDWAKRMEEDPVFKAVKGGMLVDIMGQMMATDDEKTILRLHSKLKAMEMFDQVLLQLKNDSFKARSEGT